MSEAKPKTYTILLLICIAVLGLAILAAYNGDKHITICNGSITIIQEGTPCVGPAPRPS